MDLREQCKLVALQVHDVFIEDTLYVLTTYYLEIDKKNDEEFKQQTTKYFDLLPNHYISLFPIELIMYRCVCLSLTFPLSSFPLTFRTRNFVTGYNQTSKHSIVKFDSFEFIKYYITCLINFTLEYRILYFNYGFRIFLIYDSG